MNDNISVKAGPVRFSFEISKFHVASEQRVCRTDAAGFSETALIRRAEIKKE